MAETTFEEPGRPAPGFAKSERRLCEGGFCWRRVEPHQASKQWGMTYESWQFPGGQASWAAERIVGMESRPSCVHIAQDFSCSESTTPETFMEAVRSHVEAKHIVDGVSGQGGVNTRYIGSMKSDRRIRVYRKDRQSQMYAEFFGPTLRVELELHGEQAVAWWAVWCDSREEGFAAAAAHIADMTGFRGRGEVGSIPQRVMPAAADEAEALFQFLSQYADRLSCWEQAGVPVVELAGEYAGMSDSRMALSRRSRRLRSLAKIGAADLVSMVRGMMKGGSEMEVVAC